MLRIAGQTAGPVGLKFFVDTHGLLGGCYRKIKSNFQFIFFSNFFKFFHGKRRALQLVYHKRKISQNVDC